MNDSKSRLFAALFIKWTVISVVIAGFAFLIIPNWQEVLLLVAIGAAIIGVIILMNAIAWAFKTVSNHKHDKKAQINERKRHE